MRALVLFHLKSGIRIAIQSFAPLFCALIAVLMVNMYPAAAVRSISAELFRNSTPAMVGFGALAFLLPGWGAGRLATGINGWMRHLPLSATANRRGLALGLLTLQAPLAICVLLFAVVARSQHIPVSGGLVRCGLLLACGAAGAWPVRRRAAVVLLALTAAVLSLRGGSWLPVVVFLLLAADLAAGPVRESQRRASPHAAGTLFSFRIVWRAVRWRILVGYGAALLMLGAMALFVTNNGIAGPLLSATVRFGAVFSVGLSLSSLSEQIAVRRPVWPWARSMPWSSVQRTRSDALMLALAALPLIAVAVLTDLRGALFALSALPFLAARAAGHMRGIPGRRAGAALMAAEGFAVAAALAVLEWTACVWIAAAPLALKAAGRAESRQKVTRWLELHHTVAGDPMSWSG